MRSYFGTFSAAERRREQHSFVLSCTCRVCGRVGVEDSRRRGRRDEKGTIDESCLSLSLSTTSLPHSVQTAHRATRHETEVTKQATQHATQHTLTHDHTRSCCVTSPFFVDSFSHSLGNFEFSFFSVHPVFILLPNGTISSLPPFLCSCSSVIY